MNYTIIIYIILGILPSLIWLSYYLRKDIHPEPKRMIIKIFLWGALITIPVYFVQKGLQFLLDKTSINPFIYGLIYFFLIISLSEEFFKYLVIKVKVINSPHLDEPLDIMLYMVVAALGFAAVENVLYLLSANGQMSFEITSIVYLVRFIGAVFLHTLCSAVIGYSLAISFCEVKIKNISLTIGIITATVLHGIFDFSMIILSKPANIVIPAIIILMLAFLVFAGFEKLKKMKGICKI
jgi:RsiW-degrading membrane proteinase PrsW (M82 family)